MTIRPPLQPNANGNAAGPAKPRSSFSGTQLPPVAPPLRPEDKPDAPEYKKKQAMIKGPVLELAQETAGPYGMEECTFTGLRDIFTTLIDSQSRTGVLSPQRFLDIFKRNNEMFRNSMHQDAHEFYGIVLNDVIANVEANGKRMQELAEKRSKNDSSQPTDTALSKTNKSFGARAPGTGWVHDIFEGVLTSETRCLTCETASQRDETFLDLSIDLEEHSSVTSCLQSFSAEEMLCERNKFHCDHCGGLQEAEKRMKVKKLPKILALHLKRFKYTEDYSRLQKLFHRVVYPYHLRMFNTTDDAEDPDRMYELYAVVVHIGGNAYHGHYVAVIKTKDRGWLLFDDEMVEPVDKNFVRNFFGDQPGMACAYVLFYQETTFEKVREELDAEGMDEVKLAAETADLATTVELANGTSSAPLSKLNSQPLGPVDEQEQLAALDPIKSAPAEIDAAAPVGQLPPLPPLPAHSQVGAPIPLPAATAEAAKADTAPPKTKAEISREKKELKAREKAEEKARKAAEKEQVRTAAKERADAVQKMRETTRLEREQLQQALEESRQMAAEEEKRSRKDAPVAEIPTPTATSSEAGAGAGGESDQNGSSHWNGFLNRAGRTSKSMTRKSMTRKSFAFLHIGQNNYKDEDKNGGGDGGNRTDRSETSENRSDRGGASGGGESSGENGYLPPLPPTPIPHQNGSSSGGSGKNGHLLSWTTQRADTAPPGTPTGDKDRPLKERFSFGLGRKKSSRFLSSMS